MNEQNEPSKSLQKSVIRLLVYSTVLPSYVSDPILDGKPARLDEIVEALLIHVLDCEATVAGDPESTLNERRIVRACAAAAFLAAMAIRESPE